MSKINLIGQLRKKSSGSAPKKSFFSKFSKSSTPEPDFDEEVEFSEVDSDLDEHDKKKVLVLMIGLMIAFGSRQLVPLYVQPMEDAIRQEVSSLDQEIAVEKRTEQKLKAIQEEMKQYEARVNDIKAKLAKVKTLTEDKNLLVRMTDFIIKEMPNKLWFENMTVDADTSVKLSGFTTNYQVVSEFMTKLEGAVYYPEWRLIMTTATPQNETSNSANDSNVIHMPVESKKFELEAETLRL